MIDYHYLDEDVRIELEVFTAHVTKDFSGDYPIYHTYKDADPESPRYNKVYALIHTDHALIEGESRDDLVKRLMTECKVLQAELEKSTLGSIIDHYFIMGYGYDHQRGGGFLIDAFRTR